MKMLGLLLTLWLWPLWLWGESLPTTGATLALAESRVAVGEWLPLRIQTEGSLYISLWNVGSSGRVLRLYPLAKKRAVWLADGGAFEWGGADSSLPLQVQGPVGEEWVYLVWSTFLAAHPRQRIFADRAALEASLARSGANLVRKRYQILKSKSKTYVLAMGANVDRLVWANRDARRFSRFLQRRLGLPAVQVRLLEDTRLADFRAGMAWLKRQLRPGDLAWIFYSGHASLLPDDNGDETEDQIDEGFVLFGATKTQARAHFLRDDEFAAMITALPTARVITVLDACHGGGLHRDLLLLGRVKFFQGDGLGAVQPRWTQNGRAEQGQTLTDGAKGLVLAAAGEREPALEMTDGGLFVNTLLQALEQGQDLYSAFTQTTLRVRARSQQRQTPIAVGEWAIGRGMVFP